MNTPRALPSPLTMKVRTSTLMLDYKGSTSEGIELAFGALYSKPKTRAKLLAALNEAHQRMLEREALVQPATEGQPS